VSAKGATTLTNQPDAKASVPWLSTVLLPCLTQTTTHVSPVDGRVLNKMEGYSRAEGSAMCRPFLWASKDRQDNVFVACGNDSGNKLCVWNAGVGGNMLRHKDNCATYHTDPILDIRGCNTGNDNGAILLGSLSKSELKWGELRVSEN
jgi:hypothetical protein